MADSFTDFIQNLFPSMGQTQQPMLTGTFTDPAGFRMSPEAAAYYADPFRKQNAIQQASLDAALKKKKADEAAQRLSGMLSGGGGGEMSDQGLNPAVAAFLASETQGQRDARMGALQNFLNPFSTTPTNYGTLFGLPNVGYQGGGLISSLFSIPTGTAPAPVVDMSTYSAGAGMPTIDSTQAVLGDPEGAAAAAGANTGSIGGVSLGGGDPTGVGYGTGGF